ncbi:MAG: hypothetical protein WCK56_14660 [Alcaligenaceae bacterium]
MPYFIYQVKPFAQLEKLTEHSNFAAASAEAKHLRSALVARATEKIKVMFAGSETEAEDLLCQIRDATPAGEE